MMPMQRLLLGTLAVAGIGLVLLASNRALTEHAAATTSTGVARITGTAHPIAEEALVFRTRPGDLAVDSRAPRRRNAHPRTLATYRALRAYPGAPPLVPHGLTEDEFRGSLCNTCHQRGGYSARFGAYVPVTPHPELLACLQCHGTDAAMVGTALPRESPDGLCGQCHAPARRAVSLPALDWTAPEWPRVRGARADGTPPEIPHDLQLRGDCLACHAGPGAIEEIRTSHPERASCRQCHLAPLGERFSHARTGRDGGTP
jgi:nitrate reductase (cytochrome), electron transfer subunit